MNNQDSFLKIFAKVLMETLLANAEKFGDSHRLFLQLILQQKMLLMHQVAFYFQKLCPNLDEFDIQLTPKENKKFIGVLLNTINMKMQPVGMHITQIFDEWHKDEEFLVVVSDRSFSKCLADASDFSSDELAQLQSCINLMYNKEENEDPEEENIGDIRRHAYVHIDGGISSCAAEKLLHKLVKNKWIILHQEEEYLRLHPIALAEIGTSLQQEFNLAICYLCSQPIFCYRLKKRCTCDKEYHARCLNKHLTLPAKCPNRECTEEFTKELIDAFPFLE